MNNGHSIKLVLVWQIVAASLFVSMIGERTTWAQEFRIESQVYTSDSTMPVSQNITLFSNGYVYDFQLSNDAQPVPLEIVILDTRLRSIVVLDPQRQIQMAIPDLQLLKIVDGVRRATLQDNRSNFLVEDSFTEDIDLSSNWVTLTSPQIEYRFHGQRPKDESILPQYYEFLSNFTMLNATDPTKIPPFARMRLNQSIKQLGWMPTEVQISVKQNGLLRQPYAAKSKHILMHQLSDKDRSRIATAKQYWMQFKSVELSEYRGLKKQPKFQLPIVSRASHEESVKNLEKTATSNDNLTNDN